MRSDLYFVEIDCVMNPFANSVFRLIEKQLAVVVIVFLGCGLILLPQEQRSD